MFFVSATSPNVLLKCTEWQGVCNRFSWYWEKQKCLPFPALRDFSAIKQSLPESCPIHSHHGLQVINIVSKMTNTSNKSSTNAWSFLFSRRKIINPCSKSHFCASWSQDPPCPPSMMWRQNWSSASCLAPAFLMSFSQNEWPDSYW